MVITLAAVWGVLPTAGSADHPRQARTKRFIQVDIVAAPHVPSWYIDVLARLVDKRLEDRPLPRPAAAVLVIDRRGHIETLSLTETTGDSVIDADLLSALRQAAPFPVLAMTDHATFRCVVRWSSP